MRKCNIRSLLRGQVSKARLAPANSCWVRVKVLSVSSTVAWLQAIYFVSIDVIKNQDQFAQHHVFIYIAQCLFPSYMVWQRKIWTPGDRRERFFIYSASISLEKRPTYCGGQWDCNTLIAPPSWNLCQWRQEHPVCGAAADSFQLHVAPYNKQCHRALRQPFIGLHLYFYLLHLYPACLPSRDPVGTQTTSSQFPWQNEFSNLVLPGSILTPYLLLHTFWGHHYVHT